MITCKKCGAEKPEDQMKPRGGAPSKVCIECDEKARKEKTRLKKILADARSESVSTRKKRKAKTTRRAKPEPEVDPSEVKIAAGLGCHAFLTEDNRLQIAQTPDNVVLSKTEFKVIAAQFHDWMETTDPS